VPQVWLVSERWEFQFVEYFPEIKRTVHQCDNIEAEAMNLLLLGRGKTGSLVAEVAAEHKHRIVIVGAKENVSSAALRPEILGDIDAVIDFTTPQCVLSNIEACVKAGKNMVVGTTGWYQEIEQVRNLVDQHKTGFLYAANFSIGVNLFLEVARIAAEALRHDYSGQIFERHYSQKKDAPSGTALAIQHVIQQASRKNENLEITSFREGDVVGMHELVLESSADRIYLCHDAKSRRAFAEGAVRGAEWLAGKKGFYDFRDLWRDL
jgi:4-hydroxy-tetrahydrodipicolinate reductase